MAEPKLPRTTAAMADRLYAIKDLKSELAKKVKALDDERIAIEAHLINTLPKDDSTGVQGKIARASLIVKDVPQVDDWDKVRKHIVKTGDWDILTKSLKTAYIQELWDEGKKVAGISSFPKVSVSLNKV